MNGGQSPPSLTLRRQKTKGLPYVFNRERHERTGKRKETDEPGTGVNTKLSKYTVQMAANSAQHAKASPWEIRQRSCLICLLIVNVAVVPVIVTWRANRFWA